MTEKKLSREEIARREIGSTSISRGVSLFLSFCFLFSIFAVPVSQSVIDGEDSTRVSFVSVSAGEEVSWLSRATRVNKEILRSIDLLESEIEEKSFLRALFLPPFQYVFTKYLGLCVFFGTSKKKETAKGMGVVFTLVMVVSAIMSWFFYNFILVPYDLNFLQIVVFIGLVSLTVWL